MDKASELLLYFSSSVGVRILPLNTIFMKIYLYIYIFFIQFNVPFKITSLIETSQSIGGAKRKYPGKPPGTFLFLTNFFNALAGTTPSLPQSVT